MAHDTSKRYAGADRRSKELEQRRPEGPRTRRLHWHATFQQEIFIDLATGEHICHLSLLEHGHPSKDVIEAKGESPIAAIEAAFAVMRGDS